MTSRENETMLGELAAAEGWPLADNECPHGHLAHDRTKTCQCFEALAVTLLDRAREAVRSAA